MNTQEMADETLEVNTLHHTPVLSDDMEIFSHYHEHYEHTQKKFQKKRKIKNILAYSFGGISILGLSVFGFYSDQSFEEGKIDANISHESFHFVAPEISGILDLDKENLKNHNSYTSCIESISPDTDTDVHAQQERICKELFPDSGVKIEVIENH